MSKKRHIDKVIPHQLIEKIQDNFCKTLNISLAIYDVERNSITKESNTSGFWKDYISNNSAVYPRCRAAEINSIKTCMERGVIHTYTIYCGIAAFAVPIKMEGKIIAVCIGGKVRADNPNLKTCKAEAENINADFDDFLEKYLGIPLMDNEKLMSTAALLKEVMETILELNVSKKASKDKIDEMEIMHDMLEKEIYSKTKNINEVHQKYKSIIESTLDVILAINKNGIITEINRATESGLFSTSEEIIGSHFTKFVHPDNIPEIQKLLKEIAEKKIDKINGLQIGIFDLNQNIHYLSVNAKPVYSNTNGLSEIQCIMHEITEQKKLEKELIEAKEQYSQLFESIEYGVYLADLESNILKANNAFYKMFKYTKEESEKIKVWDLFLSKNKAKECIDYVVKDKSATIIDAIAKDKNNKEFYIEFSVTTTKDRNGKITGHSGVIRDISKRIGYINKARGEETKYKGLFEHMQEGVIITTGNGEITEYNSSATYIFKNKLRPDVNIADLIPEITPEKTKRLMRKGEITIKYLNKIGAKEMPVIYSVTGVKINFDSQLQLQWIFKETCSVNYIQQKKSLEQTKEIPVEVKK